MSGVINVNVSGRLSKATINQNFDQTLQSYHSTYKKDIKKNPFRYNQNIRPHDLDKLKAMPSDLANINRVKLNDSYDIIKQGSYVNSTMPDKQAVFNIAYDERYQKIKEHIKKQYKDFDVNKADNKLLKKLSNDALGLIHNFFKMSPNPKEYDSKAASLKDYQKGELACFEYSALLSHLLHDAFSIPSYIVSLQFVTRSKNKVTYDGHSIVYPRNSNFYIETTSEKRDVAVPIKEKEFVKALTEGKGTIPFIVSGQEMHLLPRLSQKETALKAIVDILKKNRKKIMETAWKDPTKSVRNNILNDITAPRRKNSFSPNDLQYLHDALIRDHSFFKALNLQN